MSPLRFHVADRLVEIRTSFPDVRSALAAVWQSCAEAPVTVRGRHVFETVPTQDRIVVHLDGDVIAAAEERSAVLPVLDYAVYQQLARWSVPGHALLHAASLRGARSTILITGASGAGKSSLAWAGVERGYGYAGDEICVCDGERLWGVPRAVLYDPVPAGSPLPWWIEGADTESYRFVGGAGRPYALPFRRPPSERIVNTPWFASDSHVVLARRSQRCSLEHLEPVRALAALYADRWGDPHVGMGSLVSRERCWSLEWDDPRRAWDLLRDAISGP